jgi:hypothetical protein
MKTLWNLLSIIAVVNLLAVLGVGGWMVGTGRLDRERARALLTRPADPGEPPASIEADPELAIPTSVRIEAQDRVLRQEAAAIRRMRDEREQLDRALDSRRSELVAREEALTSARSQWEAATAGARAARTDEQFRKSVRLLEGVPPKQAKEWLLELVRGGQIDQAVSYLDAMSAFKAASVLKAFKGEEETKVATDLLERVRRRALVPPAAQASAPENRTDGTSAGIPSGPGNQPPKPADASRSAAASAAGNAAPAAAGGSPARTDAPVANRGAEIERPGGGRG